MTRITADDALLSKLHNCEELVEVCDPQGRVLGYFHPSVVPSSKPHESPISDEEIESSRGQRSGRPLAEILAELDRSA